MASKTLKHGSPNSTQLAEHLGLSRWTVSRVLNGHDDVSEKTQARVHKAIKELGFRPSILARGLRGGRTGVIGISFQEIESPILAKKVGRLQKHLRKAGLRSILELNGGDREAEIVSLQHFIDFRVDAIVLFGSRLAPDDPLFQEMLASELPVLAIDPEFQLPVPTIRLDREAAMSQVIHFLHALGHERFALLGIKSDPVYGPLRLAGLRKALVASSIDPDKALTSVGEVNLDMWSYDFGHTLGEEWMALPDPPTAAIALNDRIAIGAMHAVRERGHRIPDDFSIIGFDDLEIGQWTDPPLTSVSQETSQSTESIVQTLEQLLADNASVPEIQVIVPQLLIRESAGSPRA